MQSWRELVSEEAQADLDGLLNFVLPSAQQFLERYGALLPFGAVVTREGEMTMVGAYPGNAERPSDSALEILYDGALHTADENRAYAIVADVRRPDGSDAVRIETQHREGVALTIVVPYELGQRGEPVALGAIDGAMGVHRVWGDRGDG